MKERLICEMFKVRNKIMFETNNHRKNAKREKK